MAMAMADGHDGGMVAVMSKMAMVSLTQVRLVNVCLLVSNDAWTQKELSVWALRIECPVHFVLYPNGILIDHCFPAPPFKGGGGQRQKGGSH